MARTPLAEPAVLVSENCTPCAGTGVLANGSECADCEGIGRQINEVPVSVVYEMGKRRHEQTVAPPPSMVREAALREAAREGSDPPPEGGEAGA